MKSVNSISYRAIGEDFFPSYYSVFYKPNMKIIYFSSCFWNNFAFPERVSNLFSFFYKWTVGVQLKCMTFRIAAHIIKLLGELTADDLQLRPFPFTLKCPLLKRATCPNITSQGLRGISAILSNWNNSAELPQFKFSSKGKLCLMAS